ncbi:hypothetical protein ACFLWI_00590 [Chloroflexota bacterium]
MTQEDLWKGNIEFIKEIEQVRSQVRQNEKIGLRAQEDIFGLLDKALGCLEHGVTPRSQNEAACRINMARQRVTQVERQKRWLAIPIGIWLVIFTGLGAWAIYGGQFWPKAAQTPAREILFGSVLWGLVGAAIDGLRELHTRLARQELDLNRLAWYLVHPVLGGGLGGILFLLATGGLLVTGQDVVDFNPSLPLVLAALAGFEQQNIIRYLRDTVRQILRIEERNPEEGG